MKRVFFGLFAIVLIVSAAVAADGLRTEVRIVVEKALAGEREAVARYEAFAVKADEEGYPGAAALFRAAARGEKAHARRFAAILEDHGHPVPEAAAHNPLVGGTGDNLRAASNAEAAERDGMYREAVEVCKLHKATDLAKVFDQTRDSEVEHNNLYQAAARNLDSLKQDRKYYVCDDCGYTTDVRLPICPACRSKHGPE
jgi:rubrerythrin